MIKLWSWYKKNKEVILFLTVTLVAIIMMFQGFTITGRHEKLINKNKEESSNQQEESSRQYNEFVATVKEENKKIDERLDEILRLLKTHWHERRKGAKVYYEL